MKKADIKVGGEYAVVPNLTDRDGTPVRATVTELGVERKVGHGFGRKSTAKDGIRVTFPAPVVADWGTFRAPSEHDLREPVTEAVITSRCVIRTWTEQEAANALTAKARKERDEQNRRMVEAAEPRLAAIEASLQDLGVTAVVNHAWRDLDGEKRPVGASYSFGLDQLEKLLAAKGVTV